MSEHERCRACGELPAPGTGGVYQDEGFFCSRDRCISISSALSRARWDLKVATLRMNGFCIYSDEFIGFCGEKGYWPKDRFEPGKWRHIDPPVKVVSGTDYCEYHSTFRCRCGAQATEECGFTGFGPFVCGIATCGPLERVEKDGKEFLTTKCGGHQHTVKDLSPAADLILGLVTGTDPEKVREVRERAVQAQEVANP
ncbi:MAG: hypothetical protein KGJ23_07890 [Euryarchaeota archaeon]|nr:hypothetical protein [Euryarchaeota archaeon]MDE1836521.1 hypothetical protein [Euryarchaeota archaeon]MDE1879284.1 hypothetical protein [Euryarchaeota archaeon]MDE2044491.1 hypothetical protein [Thermoplasmata archaeon]